MPKYDKWLEPENLTLIEGWARDGLTDKQIAHNMGVSYSTLRDWRDKFSAISASLKKGKEVVDREVENALYRKAVGEKVTLKKPIKVRIVQYKDGKKVKEQEKIEYADEEVYIPPDTTAQIFWLKNRKPKDWKDKQYMETNEEALQKLDSVLDKIGGVI